VNIILSINPTYTQNNTASICQGQSYNLPWGGSAITAGTYSHTYSTTSGCDSVVNIILSINPTYTQNNTASICQGQSYNLPWGGSATTAGTYSHTYSTTSGCDSVVNITLSINPTYTINNTASICQGESYTLPWGGSATTAGTYSHTYSTTSGCDSVVNLILSINSNFITNNTASICQGQSYTLPWGGSATTAGTYSHTYSTTSGCDSVVNIILSINPTYTLNNTASICQGQSYNLPWGGSATTAGTYSHTYTTTSGCDSVVNLILSINSTFVTNNTASICQGQSYNLPWGGSATTAGTYSHTYSTTSGCDSFVNITLSINPTYTLSNTASICQGQSYTLPWGGSATTAGTYSHTYTTIGACDSIVNILLTVNPTPPAPQVTPQYIYCQYQTVSPLQVSGSYPLLWYAGATGGVGSTLVPQPGTVTPGVQHYFVSQLSGSCESPRASITVMVKRKPVLGPDQNVDICYGSTANLYTLFDTANLQSHWTLSGMSVANPSQVSYSGTYQLIVNTAAGCSDTSFVNLTVMPQVIANAGPDDNAVFNIPYQLHGSGGGSYTWSPATLLNNEHISSPVTTLTSDTRFVLYVENAIGCSDTDTVFIKVYKGPTFYIPNAFTPNGDGLNDDFKPTYVGIQKLDYFRIYSRFGELVFETQNIGKAWNGMYKGVMQNTGNFVYIVKGIDKNGKEKVLKGNVLLIH
jgi:gliding motility-associated-like protein